MNKEQRNANVTKLMNNFISQAKKGCPSIPTPVKNDLEVLFMTTTWGFREIILVVVIARLIDKDYKASTGLYDCNPRALYEGPIRSVLLKYSIPHRKSGPLNIAKAWKGLNEEWAAQRSPQKAAHATLRLVKWIEKIEREELINFAIALHWRFLQEAIRIADLEIEIPEESNPSYLYNLCQVLIDEVPDGGNTPQRIGGLLLEILLEEQKFKGIISGHLDRASTTSTTSKKPGDITLELDDNTILRVYEITMKPFGKERIQDSYETVRAYEKLTGSKIDEIIVVCREEDCHPEMATFDDSIMCLGQLIYSAIRYIFVDIYEWIMSLLLQLTSSSRIEFYSRLNTYVSNVNTSEKVKKKWIELHK